MERFWLFREHSLEGPFTWEALQHLQGFTMETVICREGEEEWAPAKDILQVRPRPRPSVTSNRPAPQHPVIAAMPKFPKPDIPSAIPKTLTTPPVTVKRRHTPAQIWDFVVLPPRKSPPEPSLVRTLVLFLILSILNSVYWGNWSFLSARSTATPVPQATR